ncbi:MAG: malonic semialdehyde reductase [Alphaproteobacteria bacterium]|nr:malonic semialdehyde reductase [Alphaproteobacteria bacterium]
MTINFLDDVFLKARTHSAWQDKPVEDSILREIYDLAKMGPTSANCCPIHIAFIKSKEAKEKLKPCLDAGNVTKTMLAPVTAIIAYNLEFYEQLPKLFPHADARSWFVGKALHIQTTAFRNGTLQGAYFMLAARALGLDCGPMSGFNNEAVDKAFFENTQFKSNFLCNLGYGDSSKLYPRAPRLTFDEVCEIL